MHPFEVSFTPDLIYDLKERIKRTRWPDLPFDRGWERGMDDATLRDLAAYWIEGFDFEAIEECLNRLNHLRGPIEGEQMHCVVFEGSGDRRLPLLLLHGWPGSFVEFLSAAELLASRTDAGVGSDLVVPSLPGFAFSDPPREPGMDGGRIAERIHSLMSALGYKRYGVQGGDWGAIIGTGLALQHPEAVLGLHLNMDAGTGGVPEGVTPSPAEREYLEFRDGWDYENQGYDHIQSTRPQTLTYAHNDSPVGLLGWIVEKFWAWSDHGDDLWQTFDQDLVLTNVMLYWLPGRALSAASIYFEMERGRYEFLAGRVEVPTGYARFPKDPWRPPREMVERKYNLVHYTEQPRGGHFAAMEQPQLFAADVSAFFTSL
jgi:pimeloyl-ACP methyl ester carboxylesterase